MVNSRIFILGSLDKEPKVNEDGTVDLLLTNTVEEMARKDIKAKGNSIFLVRLSKNQWNSNKTKLLEKNNEIKVIGYLKALVNKKGVPFVYVAPEIIDVYDIKKSEEKNNKGKAFKGVSFQVNIANKKYVPWRRFINPDDIIELDPRKVILEDEDHINAQFKWLDFQKGRSYSEYVVAVRKIDEDRYVLVSGLNRYIIAKIFNKKLSAYITDLTREEFAAEYEVKENI